MKTLSITAIAAALAISASAFADEQSPAVAETSASTLVTAKVNGMVCDFCARAVTKVFGNEDAVDAVHVDLDKGEIHVTLKLGAEMSNETVASLVKKSGYDLVSIAREAA